MEFPLKQRLIGAAVIIALAVVIIPMLLNGSGHKGVEQIPPPPQPDATAHSGAVREEPVPLPPADSSGRVVDAAPDAGSAPSAAPSPDSTVQAPPAVAPEPSAPAAAAEPSEPAAAPQPAPSAPAPEVAKAAPAKPAASTEPEAWVVQVGSFSEESKATALRDRLRKDKFNAFVERYTGADHRTMFRVRVGPELERARADALQKRLAEEEKLKGFVTHHP